MLKMYVQCSHVQDFYQSRILLSNSSELNLMVDYFLTGEVLSKNYIV